MGAIISESMGGFVRIRHLTTRVVPRWKEGDASFYGSLIEVMES